MTRRLSGLSRQPAVCTAVAVRGYAAAPPGEPEQLIVLAGEDWPAYAWSFADGLGGANVGFGMLLPRCARRRPVDGRCCTDGWPPCCPV